ncbi:MAG: ATP-dependent helicase [bacterium]|nr:ATP-dependent helicase [bacterium]
MKKEYNFLNTKQGEILERDSGPLIVTGAPGTGKTTALIQKAIYLIKEKKVKPQELLILTSRNNEVEFIFNEIKKNTVINIKDLWIGTSFSVCARILRSEIYRIGYSGDFVIYDFNDSVELINSCLKDLEIDPKIYPPKIFAGIILKQKFSQVSSERYITDESLQENDYFNEFAKDVYQLYQSRLKRNNSVDLGDLLMLTVKVFNENKNVLKKYQTKFKYILIDEFHDITFIQNIFIKKITKHAKFYCILGNDDESLGSDLGASSDNILKFEKENRKKKIKGINLTQNYISNQAILDAAYELISNNQKRKKRQKTISSIESISKPKLVYIDNERVEARFIAQEIQKIKNQKNQFKDMAILFRTSDQVPIIEAQLKNYKIPFETIQSESLFKEDFIKDLLAYIKICFNRNDEINLLRIINLPNRGIGLNTIEKLIQTSRQKRIPFWEVISNNLDKKMFSSRIVKNIKGFIELVDMISKEIDLKPSQFIEVLIKKVKFYDHLKSGKNSKEKIATIEKLISTARDLEVAGRCDNIPEFIQIISLYESYDAGNLNANRVLIMSIKASRDFFFKTVFIPALEDGIIPFTSIANSPEQLEEERRLLYMGMTRAIENLILISGKERNIFNKKNNFPPSRFINEIGIDLLEEVNLIQTKKGKFPLINTPFESSEEEFKVGRKITHPIWGKGIIKEITGYSPKLILTVQFARAGVKKISMEFLRNFLKKQKKRKS